MVSITERAKEALLHLKRSAGIDRPDVALRLATGQGGQLELFVDTEKPGDQVVEFSGTRLLLVDEDVSDVLSGATIDYRPTTEGPQFVVDRARRGDGRNGNGLRREGHR